MRKVPADVYKLVGTARKPSDTGRILAASRLSPKIPLVTLAMGEIGFPSRVLSTALGAVFTYAAPAHVQGTAAGQVNARQLRSPLSHRQVHQGGEDLCGDRRPGAPFGFAARAQPRVSVAADRCGLRAAAGESRISCAIFSSSPTSCRSPASASPFRTSGGSCAISIRSIRWPGASAR